MIVFFKVLFFGLVAYAEDIKTVVKEIRLNRDNRQEAQAKALNELSRELVKSMIGDNRYRQLKGSIESSIITKQNRYILSTSSSQGVLQDDGSFSFQVTLKFSKSNLKDLLLENNLFYVSEGSFCVFPLVSFISYFKDKSQSYSWWLGSDNESPDPVLHSMAKDFFNLLSGEFVKTGFYALDPVFQRMYEGTPFKVLPKKSTHIRNFIPLAQFYNCDIVLSGYVKVSQFLTPFSKSTGSLLSLETQKGEKSVSGDVRSSYNRELAGYKEEGKYLGEVFFNVFNIKTSQFLFRFKKQIPYASNKPNAVENYPDFKSVLASLAYQLSLYQKEGSLDLYRLNISVQGPLTYVQREQLKKKLLQKVLGIHSLEERLLTSNRVVYSAETSQDAGSIAKQLKKLSLPHFMIQVKGHRQKELEIYAKKR